MKLPVPPDVVGLVTPSRPMFSNPAFTYDIVNVTVRSVMLQGMVVLVDSNNWKPTHATTPRPEAY